jgi:hypothetical protein
MIREEEEEEEDTDFMRGSLLHGVVPLLCFSSQYET